MKLKFNIIIVGIILFLNISANSSNFKGYKRQPAGEPLKYIETVERINETQEDFLILISPHAAFYRFPKNIGYVDQVRKYLNGRMKTKGLIIFEIDPTTAEILNISDAQK